MVEVPTANPPSVFIDSSVYFSATYSGTGLARDLLHAAVFGRVVLVLSDYVLDETERNIREHASHVYQTFRSIHAALPYRMVTPSEELINDAARIVVAKDAPIVAGAYASGAAFLAASDRRDLLSKRQEVRAAFSFLVSTPQEILASL